MKESKGRHLSPEQLQDKILSHWPGGWYLYEEGQVKGPLMAQEAFERASVKDSSGKSRLVSRKGFTQWYPVQDLAEIYRLTETVGQKSLDEIKKLRDEVERLSSGHGDVLSSGQAARVVSRTLEPMSLKHKEQLYSQAPQSLAQPASEYTMGREPLSSSFETGYSMFAASGHDTTLAEEPLNEQSRTQVSDRPLARGEENSSSPDSINPTMNSALKSSSGKRTKVGKARSLMYHEYFLARGRMRLGKLRSPYISGLVGVPLTLGIYWVLWMSDTIREINYHLAEDKADEKFPPVWLAIIPGFHIYMAYRMGQVVERMEKENKYQVTSATTAALFGILPPLAIIYLQDAINQHWWLHVKHEMVRKQKKGQLKL